MFPFADGKIQGSSSEAVNCYYGAYLWSSVRYGGGGADRAATSHPKTDFARLLLAMEMTGAKTYWHMVPSTTGNGNGRGATTATTSTTSGIGGGNSGGVTIIPTTVYGPAFSKNYMVGNLGMTDVTCTTWFGTETAYVHLINFLPVTAITAELFD